MIGLALVLSLNTTSGDTTPRPEVARLAATRLHETPTPTPSPVPEVTPPAGWNKLGGPGFELWLPGNYAQLKVSERVTSRRILSRGNLTADALLYAYDTRSGLALPLWDVSILRVRTELDPRQVAFGVEARDGDFAPPTATPLGRYSALETIARGPNFAGIPLQMMDLVFWIRRGEYYWVLIYTAPDYDFSKSLSTLTQSASTFRLTAD